MQAWALEEAKQTLETRTSEVEYELKQLSSTRQETEYKSAERQLQEATDKVQGDLGEKAARRQVRCFTLLVFLFYWHDLNEKATKTIVHCGSLL